MNSQLFCTFSNTQEYESSLIQICRSYDITYNKIYVLKNIDDDYPIYLTYNAVCEDYNDWLPKTIAVHRKKHTNTLYTINALNELVIQETGGEKDESFEINWEDYRNSIILTSGNGINIINTSLLKIINV